MARIVLDPDNCIISLMYKHNICLKDICKSLKIVPNTYYKYINDPSDITYNHLHLLASLFGLTCPQFIYMLERNKSKLSDSDIWYLDKSLSSV